MTDVELAAFATPTWIESVASVPVDEVAMMVCEDPSVVLALVGAVRHARTERDVLAHDLRQIKAEREQLLVENQVLQRKLAEAREGRR